MTTPQEEAAKGAADFVDKLNTVILFPTISLLSGIAILVFLYGSFIYIVNASNEQAREEGKKHIVYGLIGLVVMISAFAILSIAVSTFGLNKNLDCADNPKQTGCATTFKVK